MATASELTATINQRRQELRAAIEAASSTWGQSPGGEEWSPQKTAEHTVGMAWMYAGLLADALKIDAPQRGEISFETPQAALSALEAAIADAEAGLSKVTDADLTTPAEIKGEVPSPDVPKTVEGVLWLTAFHLDDHAKQIAAAASAS